MNLIVKCSENCIVIIIMMISENMKLKPKFRDPKLNRNMQIFVQMLILWKK